MRWYDDLYWLGVVQQRNADGTYVVAIENGDTEHKVPADPKYILPYSRSKLFEGAEVLVYDGHSLVPGVGMQGETVPIRLMSFRSSPHLYQSGCLLDVAADGSR